MSMKYANTEPINLAHISRFVFIHLCVCMCIYMCMCLVFYTILPQVWFCVYPQIKFKTVLNCFQTIEFLFFPVTETFNQTLAIINWSSISKAFFPRTFWDWSFLFNVILRKFIHVVLMICTFLLLSNIS